MVYNLMWLDSEKQYKMGLGKQTGARELHWNERERSRFPGQREMNTREFSSKSTYS